MTSQNATFQSECVKSKNWIDSKVILCLTRKKVTLIVDIFLRADYYYVEVLASFGIGLDNEFFYWGTLKFFACKKTKLFGLIANRKALANNFIP